LVDDVREFPGHVACDARSRSEIVVPVVQGGTVVAVIDVDCAAVEGFDVEDSLGLTRLARLLADSCDFPLTE
jgi:L-methionine (R)-S-oxide reductase